MINIKSDSFKKVITILISIIISLYIIEIFLKILSDTTLSCLNNREIKKKLSSKYNYSFDERFIYEYVRDENLKTIFGNSPSKYVSLENISDYNFIPLSSFSNEKIYLCNETGEHSFYQSDRYGFNNIDEIWEEKIADLILIGDSFVTGSCTNKFNENNISDYFKKKNLTTINLGFPGHGPLLEYATFVEYGKSKKPKKLLWFYYEGNDLKGLNIEKKSQILNNYLDGKSYNLINKQKKIEALLIKNEYKLEDLEKFEQSKIFENNFCNLKMQKIRKLVNFSPPILKNKKNEFLTENNFKLFEKIILGTRDSLSEWGGELIIVYLPELARYKKNFVNHDTYKKKKNILNMIRRNNIKVIDIHEEFFSNQKDPLSFFPLRSYGHYNLKGYERISRIIYNYLY